MSKLRRVNLDEDTPPMIENVAKSKLRRIDLNEDLLQKTATVVSIDGKVMTRGKGAPRGERHSIKYKPEEHNNDLFQVLALGGESSNRKIPLMQFVRAMIEADGFQARAAAKLGIHYSTLKKYMKEYPKLKTLSDDIQEMLLDLAESKLKGQIKQGNLNAIQYYLNCKGRHRGWISDPKAVLQVDKTPVFVFKPASAKKVG